MVATALPASLVSDYARDGYVVVDDSAILERLPLEALWDSMPDETGPGRYQDAWRLNPWVRKVAAPPVVIDALRRLYGREPIPFQTLNSRNGSEQETHSDATPLLVPT